MRKPSVLPVMLQRELRSMLDLSEEAMASPTPELNGVIVLLRCRQFTKANCKQ